jgi:ABC-type multidrug transport system permease subunit
VRTTSCLRDKERLIERCIEPTTNSFYQRGSLLFFAILLNAFGSALEILTLYAQRSIVEKHAQYAFYHPSAEAFASMLTDMPYKILNAIVFNITLYFMTNLRREPGSFTLACMCTGRVLTPHQGRSSSSC